MCESLRPGITVRPFPSMILLLGPRNLKMSRSLPIAMIFPSVTAIASTNDGTPFVAILALCNIVSAGIEISLFLIVSGMRESPGASGRSPWRVDRQLRNDLIHRRDDHAGILHSVQ